MIIRELQLRIDTSQGLFGFSLSFDRNLTIIRAGNSCGKSTFFNSLLYAIGMEEIIGGKGPKILQSAVQEHFEYKDTRIDVLSSEVRIEIENSIGNIVTLQRSIKSEIYSDKLVEVYTGALLSRAGPPRMIKSTFLHDAGSSLRQEGFYHFLEDFLDLKLPKVATTNGKEAKLYLQTIFAALAIEQKRGWTDYIANIPYYGIRDAKTYVAQFLLGLNTFEIEAKKNQLNNESSQINTDWKSTVREFERLAKASNITLENIPNNPPFEFDSENIKLNCQDIDISSYLLDLREKYESLAQSIEQNNTPTSNELSQKMDMFNSDLQKLNFIREQLSLSLSLKKASLEDLELLLTEATEDLAKNKATEKLKKLGAVNNFKLSQNICPTCNQPIIDSLLSEALQGPCMDISTNIAYIESQCRMLKQQINGTTEDIEKELIHLNTVEHEIEQKYDLRATLRRDIHSGESMSRTNMRRQLQIEIEVDKIQSFINISKDYRKTLETIAERLYKNKTARENLPKNTYSQEDEKQISIFTKEFRLNAGTFDYQSAPINDITINKETLIPCLADIELREIIKRNKTDIKFDSSASDFVRLIWSYLIALYQASIAQKVGNHPNILLFDEPGQHSMAVESQRALLQRLSSEKSLQSIVAASFDESENVFNVATSGVKFKLIQWEGKLIQPVS